MADLAAPPAPPISLIRHPLRRLLADWSDPLLRNGYALVLNVGITSVLGLAYWILATHLFSKSNVGLGTDAINLMQLMAGVGGQLTFQAALTRFIPHAGTRSTRLALISYSLAGGAGAVVSLLYLIGLRVPALGLPAVVGRSWGLGLLFGASVTVWCVFALQDAVLTGIRQAVWIPVENGLYGIGKIVMLVAVHHVLRHYGIFFSWIIPAAVALVPVNLLIYGRLLPRHEARERAFASAHTAPVTFSTMARFMGGDYLGTVFFMAMGTILPLLITVRINTTNAAYFGVVYVIIYALDLVTVNLGVALMVEGAIDRASLRGHAKVVIRRIGAIIIPAAAVIVVFSHLILSIYGHDYAAHASTLFRLLAVAVLFKAVTSLYIALSRVERKVSRIAFAQGALFTMITGASWVLMGHLGLNGVGVAYLVSQVVVAAAVLPSILRMLAPVGARSLVE